MEDFESRFPFYKYAYHYWTDHARSARRIPEQALKFLIDNANTLRYYSFLEGHEDDDKIIGIHLAARYHLNDLMIVLVKRGQSPEAKTSRGTTPLMFAALANNGEAAHILLHQYDVDPNVKDFNHTALGYATDHWSRHSITEGREPNWNESNSSPKKSVINVLLEQPSITITLDELIGALPRYPRLAVRLLTHERMEFNKDKSDRTSKP